MRNASQYDRKYYSAALAPLQVKFVSRVPPKVKTLIRLIDQILEKNRIPSNHLHKHSIYIPHLF